MIRPRGPKPAEPQPVSRAVARSIKTLLIGVGLGIGLLAVFYCVLLPAKPFIYVGF